MKDKKDAIDWVEREKMLSDLCDRYRRSDGKYDCLVPGSGGKDSVFTAHILKTKYRMNPLTLTWAPHIHTDWGWKNFRKWTDSGFDNVLTSQNGKVHRLLTRLALENLFHPFQPFFLGQKSLAPKMAITYDIPLVFYGENEAEYGNAIKSSDKPLQDPSYYSLLKQETYMSGISIQELQEDYRFSLNDLEPYFPADPNKLIEKKVEVHYLGFYLKWHPQACYYYCVENCGFEPCPERNAGTYSRYASLDDKIDDFHFYTTFIKFGIGRATYDASQEIRSGDITREEGVRLVKKFDGEYPTRFEDDLFSYLSITKREYGNIADYFEYPIMNREYFKQMVDAHRSPHLWNYNDGQWQLRGSVWSQS